MIILLQYYVEENYLKMQHFDLLLNTKLKKKIILKNVSWRKKRILSLSSNLKKFTHNLMLFLIQFF